MGGAQAFYLKGDKGGGLPACADKHATHITFELSRQPCKPAGCPVGFGAVYEKVRC